MEFEWDENKRQEVRRERKLDFARAAKALHDPARLTMIDTRHDYGEERLLTMGSVEGECYIVAYTMRGHRVRIITAWKVNEHGQRRFAALFQRRN